MRKVGDKDGVLVVQGCVPVKIAFIYRAGYFGPVGIEGLSFGCAGG